MANLYGAQETNGLNGSDYHNQIGELGDAYWTDKGLKITRLRLLSDPGYPVWDVSYCHGVLNGQNVRVGLPFSQIPKGKVSQFIVEEARKERVYAKGLGILDCISTLI